MPWYPDIDFQSDAGQRTARGLLALKQALEDPKSPQRVPPSSQRNLLLATWNLREFSAAEVDVRRKAIPDDTKCGPRQDEALHYIAEIISHFDLVAVQEVREQRSAYSRLLRFLGRSWQGVLTEQTLDRAGNQERLAFLYNADKVSFGGLAGQVVLKPRDGGAPVEQLARTPFMIGFRAGWFDFITCTAHIIYGKGGAQSEERRLEIGNLAGQLRQRADDVRAWSRNLFVLGDFNIFDPADATFQEITKAGFIVPKQLQALPSNALQNKHYDQIGFYSAWRSEEEKLGLASAAAGVFDYYQHVYRDDPAERALYLETMAQKQQAQWKAKAAADQAEWFKTTWRTFQMSDHLPMWIELRTDFSREYLERKLGPAPATQSAPALAGPTKPKPSKPAKPKKRAEPAKPRKR